MKIKLFSAALCLVVLGFIVGISGCNGGVKSPSNARFTIQVSGEAGAAFTGFSTQEVKYLTGSRTEETDIQGKITVDKTTIEFTIRGTEISCKMEPKTPQKPITITALKDNVEFYHVENTVEETYFAWYP